MSKLGSSFYITGGTLPRDASSYVERTADAELLARLRIGQFCYVLTSRQMGKSSLMVQTVARLRHENVVCAVIDLTAIGQNLDVERWYAASSIVSLSSWKWNMNLRSSGFRTPR